MSAREGAGNVSDERRYPTEAAAVLDGENKLVGLQLVHETPQRKVILTVRRAGLEAALSRAGLALVSAADVPTPEERAVLKECAALDEASLLDMTSDDYYAPTYAHDLGQAIIAWKAAKEAKG